MTQPLQPGDNLLHYRLIGKVGEGGMGVVWKAFDHRLEREIAIKVLPDTLASDRSGVEQFHREAKAIAALNHPNIVSVYSVEESKGVRFFTMELVAGRTLSELIPPSGMALDRFFELAGAITHAICAAHDKGITHRDLKPANVMVGDDGRVKILDFGLAILQRPPAADDADVSARTRTASAAAAGTMPYMSPEELAGKQADQRSDIFSLGVMLYEMTAGRRPFQAGTAVVTASSILRDNPAPLGTLRPGVPAGLVDLVAGCLEKDPGDRPLTVRQIHDRLAELQRGAGAGKASEAPSIAVLPFTDMSPGHDHAYFCDGISEEIINSLTKIQGLRVASRLSAFGFRDSTADSRAIGARLEVGTLLQGGVRRSGDRLRITAQLIDVADDSHIWSERYDRQIEDIFAIQEDIAQSIVSALRVALTPRESRGLQQTPTAHVAAYDCYLRGVQFFYKGSRRDHGFARQMFMRAIEIDPSFTRAYAGLADTLAYAYKHFDRDPGLLEQADAASAKAIELGSDRAEARTSRGVVHWLQGRYDEADREFSEATQLDPTLFDAWFHFGISCYNRGRLEQAARLFEQSAKVRPDDYQSPILAGGVYRGLGLEARSAQAFRQGLDVTRKHLELHPDDARAFYLGAGALVALKQIDQGLEWAQRAFRMDPDNTLVLYNLAGIYACSGRIEEGLEFIERAVRLGYRHKEGLLNDPDFAPLRGHPRWKALVESLG